MTKTKPNDNLYAMDFTVVLINVALLVAMAVPGYILRKLKMLPQDVIKGLDAVLMFVAQPFLVLSSFSKKEFEPALLANMGWTALFSLILIILLYSVCRLIFLLDKKSSAAKVSMTAGYLNNCAFMGIPVVMSLFPGNGEPLIYCAVFNVIFNILAWTLSVYSITGDRKYINIKKAFLNPPTVALIVALPLFFLKISLPAAVLSTVDFLGNMTSPLSMIIIGIRLADIQLKIIFNSAKVYLSAAIKLVVSPLLTFGLLMLFRLIYPLDDMVIITLLIIMAMPTAATVLMFSEMFGGESETAAKCVLLSTIFSIITIPLIMLLVNLI